MVYDIIQLAGSGTDRAKLQDIKTFLYTKLVCQAIDTIEVVYLNYSLNVEAIGQRLSFLAFSHETPVDTKFEVHFVGPKIVTSDMIPHCIDTGDNNVYLFFLNTGDEIHLKFQLTSGCAQDHAKFCHFTYLQNPDNSCDLEIRNSVYPPIDLSSISFNSSASSTFSTTPSSSTSTSTCPIGA